MLKKNPAKSQKDNKENMQILKFEKLETEFLVLCFDHQKCWWILC